MKIFPVIIFCLFFIASISATFQKLFKPKRLYQNLFTSVVDATLKGIFLGNPFHSHNDIDDHEYKQKYPYKTAKYYKQSIVMNHHDHDAPPFYYSGKGKHHQHKEFYHPVAYGYDTYPVSVYGPPEEETFGGYRHDEHFEFHNKLPLFDCAHNGLHNHFDNEVIFE